MIKLSREAHGIHAVALMNDFLIAWLIKSSLVISEAMGKGIGINVSHDGRKGQPVD